MSTSAVVQFVAAICLADFIQYWVHYACHRVPILWRFHEVHHSAKAMDWLAGSRLHIIDAVLTRALIYAPLFLLGFDPAAIGAYLVFVVVQATFVHANVRFVPGWVEPWLATPRFHHWHHADTPADKNFAVHLPIYDRLFGTHHMPGGSTRTSIRSIASCPALHTDPETTKKTKRGGLRPQTMHRSESGSSGA